MTGTRTKSENAGVRSEPAIATTRVDKLRELVLEAGLVDRVRVGASCPPAEAQPVPRTHRTANERPSTPGAEEAFSPDALLRPHSRGAVRANEGRLIELAGARSSGKTALAYRMAAGATSCGELVGWVDLPNALDPALPAARAGEARGRALGAAPESSAALRAAELLIKTGFALVVLDLEGARPRELAQLGASVWTRLLRALARVAFHGAPARRAARRGLVRDAGRVDHARARAVRRGPVRRSREPARVLRSREAVSRSDSASPCTDDLA